MTKTAALFNFWSSFGLTAYEENTVPTGEDTPEFPYLTYSVATGGLGAEIALSASLWYRSSSWVEANEKAQQISKFIGYGGTVIPCDGGVIWLKRGSPFAQNMGDESDSFIRRKYINITAEFLTAN